MSKEYIDREEVIKILERYDLSSGSTHGCHSGAIECAISAPPLCWSAYPGSFFRAAALSLMKLSTLSGNSERGHGIFQFYRRKRHHNIMSKEVVIKHLDNLYNRMYALSL